MSRDPLVEGIAAELEQPVREGLRDLARGRLAAVLDWQRRYGVPVLPLSAAEETLPQLRRLMGLGPR